MRLAIYAAVLSCGLVVPVHAQQPDPASVPVGVVKAERKSIETTLDFVGRVDAINRVQVQARVTGYLEAVLFKEGDAVKEGDPLYRIEHGLFEAAVKQAEADLEKAKAQKILSAVQLQRAEDLLAKNAGTAAARDQAKAADDTAAANVLSAEANLQTARINLGYTDIASPIAGKIGKTNITKGNVVSPGSGVLTTIVSQDPMYVSFPVSQREFLRAREAGRHGDTKNVQVRIKFSDGSIYDQVGEINFVDVTVDRSTDTVLVRATLPNPTGALIDGQLVQVIVATGGAQEKVLVPQAALIADQGGVYVFIVEDNKAAIRRLKIGGQQGADAVVDDGLKGGELVIVDGIQSIHAGSPVRPHPLPSMLGGT